MPHQPTLAALATARAEQDHSRRLAEIKAMAPLLAHLDPLLPALKAQGLEVFPCSLQLHTHCRNSRTQKVLRIDTSGVLDVRKPARWLQVLLDLGFQETERSSGAFPQVILRKGHLLLKVDAPRDPVEAARSAQAFATRAAAEAAAAVTQLAAA